MTHPATLAAILSLAALGLIPGAAAGGGEGGWGPDSPHYRFPAGLGLRLLREIVIPPESATVRLQYGRIVARNGVQEHDPHCIFELDTVRDSPQTARPQALGVTRVTRSVTTFSGLPAWPGGGWHAGPRLGRVAFDDGGSPSHLYFKTEFRLSAPDQPEIRSLTCQSNQMAPGIPIMRHLTLGEMREALGDYFAFVFP